MTRRKEQILRLEEQLRVARLETEQTRQVLEDWVHEKGLPPWLVALANEREALIGALDRSRVSDTKYGEFACCGGVLHRRDCETQRLLRLIDTEEAQRQVDDDHAAALREDFERRPRSLPIRRGDDGLAYTIDGDLARAVTDIPSGRLVALTSRGLELAGPVHPGAVAVAPARAGEPVAVADRGQTIIATGGDRPMVDLANSLLRVMYRAGAPGGREELQLTGLNAALPWEAHEVPTPGGDSDG